MPSLKGGSSAISALPLHLVLCESDTDQYSYLRKEIPYFPLLYVSHIVSFLPSFFTPLFLAVSDFSAQCCFFCSFSLTALTFSDTSSLNVIRSKPTLNSLGGAAPEKSMLCILNLLLQGMLLWDLEV